MKLNESASWGWLIAAVAIGFLTVTALSFHTNGSALLGGALLNIALWAAYRAGRERGRSAIEEVLPNRPVTIVLKEGKLMGLRLDP